jgi:ubiquinol-cytochrome c reductase cytochrome b subunit
MAISFMGYILAWGQMSLWGGTVITNLFSFVPCLIEWLCGGFYVSSSTLNRFFIFHIILPFISIGLVIIHFSYLHSVSSSNPLGYNSSNQVSFYPSNCLKDMFSVLILLGMGIIFQLCLGIFSLSHPDNSLEVHSLVTPLHIVPEWYFLSFYGMLKSIPSKFLGFIILYTSILLCLLLGEVNNVSTISKLTSSQFNNGNLFITYFFLIILSEVFIGAQLPLDVLVSSGRVLNLLSSLILWSNLWCYLSSIFSEWP